MALPVDGDALSRLRGVWAARQRFPHPPPTSPVRPAHGEDGCSRDCGEQPGQEGIDGRRACFPGARTRKTLSVLRPSHGLFSHYRRLRVGCSLILSLVIILNSGSAFLFPLLSSWPPAAP